jgi:hypothetical protein
VNLDEATRKILEGLQPAPGSESDKLKKLYSSLRKALPSCSVEVRLQVSVNGHVQLYVEVCRGDFFQKILTGRKSLDDPGFVKQTAEAFTKKLDRYRAKLHPMTFDRAMGLMLEGKKVRRSRWPGDFAIGIDDGDIFKFLGSGRINVWTPYVPDMLRDDWIEVEEE